MSTKFNFRYIFTISLVSALGGFLFGYDWVVIGGAKFFYERFFHLTDIKRLVPVPGLHVSKRRAGSRPG
jgi:hypothetical protein